MAFNITVGKAIFFNLGVTMSSGQDTGVAAVVSQAPSSPNIVARINPSNPRELGIYAAGPANGSGNGVGVTVTVGGASAQVVVFGVAPPAPTVTSVSLTQNGGEIDTPSWLLS